MGQSNEKYDSDFGVALYEKIGGFVAEDISSQLQIMHREQDMTYSNAMLELCGPDYADPEMQKKLVHYFSNNCTRYPKSWVNMFFKAKPDSYIQNHFIPNIKWVKSRFIEESILSTPIRCRKREVYQFDKDEIYHLNHMYLRPLTLMESENNRWRGYGVNNIFWWKATTEFKPGMTLEECISIFLRIPYTEKKPADFSYLERLFQKIDKPSIERDLDNPLKDTFDWVRVDVSLSSTMFRTRKELTEAIRQNRSYIDELVLQRIEESRSFRHYHVPVNCLRLTSLKVGSNYTLEYIFELKEQLLTD